MFVYLVNVFNAMPAGRIIGAIFYICVLFAGVSSIVNLYEAPIAFLQEQFKFKRAAAVGTIGVIGLVVSIAIQPWTSQWMDVVSIYICPLGALLAGIMFFWVMKKDTALAAVHEGRTAGKKDISGWFYPLGKWVYCAASLAALILGAIYGGIG
jgi:transporter